MGIRQRATTRGAALNSLLVRRTISYWSFHSRGPIVFLGKSFFGDKPSIFDVVKARAKQDQYDDMVTLVNGAEGVTFILSHPMVPEPNKERAFGLSNLSIGET